MTSVSDCNSVSVQLRLTENVEHVVPTLGGRALAQHIPTFAARLARPAPIYVQICLIVVLPPLHARRDSQTVKLLHPIIVADIFRDPRLKVGEEVTAQIEAAKDHADFGIGKRNVLDRRDLFGGHAEFGEALMAVVEPQPGVSLDMSAVRAQLKTALADYKVPKHIEIQTNLPREDSGKIFKRRLRDPYWERAGRRI